MVQCSLVLLLRSDQSFSHDGGAGRDSWGEDRGVVDLRQGDCQKKKRKSPMLYKVRGKDDAFNGEMSIPPSPI